ncbi:MAG: hypothetical protein V8R89_04560 [Alphaproteobacteria bacterium]
MTRVIKSDTEKRFLITEYKTGNKGKARAALPIYKMYFDKFNELSGGEPVSSLSDEQKDKYHQEAFKFVQESWQLDDPWKRGLKF